MSGVEFRSGKLLALAFDHAATEPEAISAFVMFRRQMIEDGRNWHELLSHNINRPRPSIVFPFGKYKGCKVLDVFDTDPDYLRWFSEKIEGKPELVKFIREILQRPK